jgi:phytoene dehydrogenase-like protein
MNNNYDVVIIGAGISGLTAGVYLVKKGKKVLILEGHTEIGGYLSGFIRKGYCFDAGLTRSNISYVEPCLRETGILDNIRFAKIDGDYYIHGKYLPYADLKGFFSSLADAFADQKEGILSLYNREIAPREKKMKIIMYSDFKHMGKLRKYYTILRIFMMMPSLMRENSNKQNENDLLKKYIDENSDVFAFLCTRPDQVNHRGYGKMFYYAGRLLSQLYNYYPRDGYLHLCMQLKKVFTDHGGELFTNSRVFKILIENNVSVGVVYRGQNKVETVRAENIISAIDLNKTFHELIGKEHIPPTEMQKLESSVLGSSVPILFLGLRLPPERLRQVFNGKEELNYYPLIKKLTLDMKDINFFVDCQMVIHCSSLVNPYHAPQGCSNIQVYLPCPPVEWQQDWGLVDGQKTEKYRELKKRVIEDILSSMEKIIPELKDRSIIEVCELGTPHTNERYTGNTHGTALGYSYDRYFLTASSRDYFYHLNNINNLFFIGHQTGVRGGLGTALGSAKNVANIICK